MRSADRTKSGATRRRDDHGQDEQLNIFQRMVLFLKQVVWELKKVRYPTPQELRQYFIVVIVFVAVLMAFTGLVDFIFAKVNSLVFM